MNENFLFCNFHLGAYFRCDLKVVSDANEFYIETILKHHGLERYFSKVITNPISVDGEGILRIFPYHMASCNLCPPNLCKVSIFSFSETNYSSQ